MIDTVYSTCLFYDKVNFVLKVTIFSTNHQANVTPKQIMATDRYAEHVHSQYLPSGSPLAATAYAAP